MRQKYQHIQTIDIASIDLDYLWVYYYDVLTMPQSFHPQCYRYYLYKQVILSFC